MATASPLASRDESAVVDWEAVERTPEFRAVVAARRRFTIPALLVWAAWVGAFLILFGYARDFMSRSLAGGFTVAFAASLSLIVMTWAITWLYLRYSQRVLSPLVERAVAAAEAPATAGSGGR
jgi:uncharacterized membrane protein (DUF485 family)